MFKRVSLLLAALALLLVAGCSKAPETEMQNTQAAFDAAVTAEVEQYAPEAYRMLKDTLDAAQAAKQEQDSKFALLRSYGKSKELYVAAQSLADKAKAEAEAEKERVKSEVTDMIAAAQAEIDKATAALASAPRGKGSKADIELIKGDLASATAAFAEAKADFDGGKYLASKAKVEAVIAKAQSITAEIEAAKAKKKG